MIQIPCPNCGEMVKRPEEAGGGETPCPRCRVILQFNADSSGRPAFYRSQRRWVKLQWVGVVGVFLMGLAIGFVGGWGSRQGSSAFSQSAFSFFFASNHMIADESKETPPPKPKVPKADEDKVLRK